MKHWLFYINIPRGDIKDIPMLVSLLGPDQVDTRVDTRMRHDPARPIGDVPHLKVSDDGSFMYGLYAWTSDKDTAKIFKSSRNSKYFTCEKMDIPIETVEWEALRSGYSSYEIMKMKYSDGKDNYAIPMTHFESDILCDNQSELVDIITEHFIEERERTFGGDDDFVFIIDGFEDSLAKALDLLAWSEFVIEYGFLDSYVCKSGSAGDDPDYLIDDYYTGLEFGCGISGGKSTPYEIDLMSAYIFMLGDLLSDG